MNNAYSAYKKQSVNTLSNGEIVIKLFTEIERRLNRASFYIDEKNKDPMKNNIAEINAELLKAQELIDGLRSCLDMSIPMSKDLDALYEFFGNELYRANMEKSKERVDAVIPMIAELREAFAQADAENKKLSTTSGSHA